MRTIINFNQDYYQADAIAQISKREIKTANLPYQIVVTYKYITDYVTYDFKTEDERDTNFNILVTSWCQVMDGQ